MKPLHSVSWWIWALSLSIALSLSHDPRLALTTVLLVSLVVLRFRTRSPWSDGFAIALRIAAIVLAFRILIALTISVPIPGRTLFTLPTIPLPSWMVGIRLGGPVTIERLSSTLGEALILAAIIAIIGAANSLTSPRAILRSAPFYFYEFGLILVISTSLVPELISSAKRIRQAHYLRGIEKPGVRRLLTPLLEEALDRSLHIAESMDARGYGISRRRSRYRPERWSASDLLLITVAIFALIIPALALLLVITPHLCARTPLTAPDRTPMKGGVPA